jgi:two-component system KDP operon response regulator KdpE
LQSQYFTHPQAQTCRSIRRVYTKMPILMLTVRDSVDDKVEALEAGADDYVTKPFQTRELVARIRAAVRRFRAPETPAEMPIANGGITSIRFGGVSNGAGVEIHPTPREFDAVQLLMTHAGRPITYARLLVLCGVLALETNGHTLGS